MKVGLITLGCDKNTVDNEYLAGLLEQAGVDVSFPDSLDEATTLDALVVLTCGFIADAKMQSLELLDAAITQKQATGYPRFVIAAGCLAQRYAADLQQEMPGLDGIVGVGKVQALVEKLLHPSPKSFSLTHKKPTVTVDQYIQRKRSGTKPYTFLKIADGCNHTCSFCAIPLMKGPYRSVAMPILLEEARYLLSQGVRELVLVAQDVAAYGRDVKGGPRLPELLRALCRLEGDFWIRCMYCYPTGVTTELLDVIAEEPKVVPYLDIPLQHVDADILKSMRRPGDTLDIARMLTTIRERVPDIAIRTTMIVGYPGETPKAHQRMLDAVETFQIDWLGAFMYSPEEDTPAATAPRQVGKAVKEKRWHAIMATQEQLAVERNQVWVGRTVRVLVDEYNQEQACWTGRSTREAPEVDGCIFIASPHPLTPGMFVDVTITQADAYDRYGQLIEK